MKEKVGLLVVVALLVVMLPMNVWAHTVDDPYIVDLIAGGGNVKSAMDVGDLRIWNDGESLHVLYWIEDEDWCLTETQLQVFLDDAGFSDVPHKNGNPIPGRFGFRGWHAYYCVTTVHYSLPTPGAAGTEIKIAAHGVVMSGMWGRCDLVDETIWAAVTEYDNGNLVGLDFPFPGKNWATYVKYVVQ